MSRTSLATRAVAGFLAVAALATLLVVLPTLGVLLVPATVLGLALLAGLFPGEQAIERLRRARASTRARRSSAVDPPAVPFVARRVGRLMAFALAMRPPPAPAAT